jgi:hypothetical protein
MRDLEHGASVPVRRQRLYWPGDVIVVRRIGHWNAHRFLGYAPSARGLLALTAADDASVRDPAATLDAIVGRADCAISASDRIGAVAKYARALLRRIAKVRR